MLVVVMSLLNVNRINKIFILGMHSSLSFNSQRDKLTNKKPDFQKDILMPNIYASENFEIIKNNSYPARKERKVVTAKKAKVHSVVEAIIAKKNIEVSKKVPNYSHRLSRPVSKIVRKPVPTLSTLDPDNMVMDFDERLNEKAMYYEEQSTIAKEKMREVMEKINGGNNHQAEDYNEEVNFYLTSLSPPKKTVPISIQQIYFSPERPSKEAKGFVEEQEERQKKWQLKNRKQITTKTQMTIKPRPKTADSCSRPRSYQKSKIASVSQFTSTLFRSNSLMNTKLNRFAVGSEVVENLKLPEKNNEEKQKIKHLFNKIQASCLANTMEKGKLVAEMNKLGMLWKSESQFCQAKTGVTVMSLSKDSFTLLQSIRKREIQMAKLDDNFINEKTKTAAQQH